jgi:hypothetical protein
MQKYFLGVQCRYSAQPYIKKASIIAGYLYQVFGKELYLYISLVAGTTL